MGACLEILPAPLDPAQGHLGHFPVFHRGSGPVPTSGGGGFLFTCFSTSPDRNPQFQGNGLVQKADGGKRVWLWIPKPGLSWQLAGPV